MKYLVSFIFSLIFLFDFALASADKCLYFYKIRTSSDSQITKLAEEIVELHKATHTPIINILMTPSIRVRLSALRSTIPSADNLLKTKIKEVQNSPKPEIVKEKSPKQRFSQKRIEKILVPTHDYAVFQNISHLFRQNPDKIHDTSGGRLIVETRYGVSEILVSNRDGTVIPHNKIEKPAGSIYASYTALKSGNIAFIIKNGSARLVFMVPNSNVVLPELQVPMGFIPQLKPLPNGDAILNGGNGIIYYITEPKSPKHPGTYQQIDNIGSGLSIQDMAVLPNNDFVAADSNAAPGLTYYRWDAQKQKHVRSYVLFQGPNGHKGRLYSVEYLSDGRLATTGYDGKVVIWKRHDISNTYTVEDAHFLGGFVWNARELPNGNLVVNTNLNKLYIMVKDETGKFTPKEQRHPMAVIGSSLTVLPNGTFITMGDPTQIGYTSRGYPDQVKEVYVWKQKAEEIEVEVEVEDSSPAP